MRRTALVPVMSLVLTAAAVQVAAQSSTGWGAPAQGINVPSRMTPGQSQSVLTMQAPAAPAAPAAPGAAPGVPGAAPAAPGAAADQPYMNDTTTGTVQGGRMTAQQAAAATTPIPASEIYRGVIPGHNDTLPHIERHQRAAHRQGASNSITWLGFQPLPELTRVFIQTGRSAQYQVIPAADGMTITVRLTGTGISLANFGRDIDASFFGRAVTHIDARRGPKGATDVVISLSKAAVFTSSVSGDYLYIDFDE